MNKQHTPRVWMGCFLLGCLLLAGSESGWALQMDTIYKRTTGVVTEEKISLSIRNADIQSVLKALSQQRKMNIVCSPDVAGDVSVHLYEASLDEALEAVITANGFQYTKKDEVLYVSKAPGEMSSDMMGQILGREVRTFRLNYVDLKEVEKNVQQIVSPSAVVSVYAPEKTLIVEDVAPYLDRVERLLQNIDVPPKQVLIEARIMEVRLNDGTKLGIDWSYFFNHSDTEGLLSSFGFAAPGDQGLFFQSLGKNFEVFLDALQSRTTVNTLATPKLLALDNREAKIIVGEKLGYFVATSTNTATVQSVEFLETGTQLRITPHIMDDGNILMEIHPEVSDGIVQGGLPSETTTEVTTHMIAQDGDTLFIGGLIRDRKEDTRDQVPALGCLPLVGVLFGKSTNTTQKTEIIVLITPRIMAASEANVFQRDADTVNAVGERLERKRSLRDLLPRQD